MLVKSAQNQSISREICQKNSHQIGHFLTDFFLTKLAPKTSTKSLRNRPIFLWICLWKSRKIWLIFRNLSEALTSRHNEWCSDWLLTYIQVSQMYFEYKDQLIWMQRHHRVQPISSHHAFCSRPYLQKGWILLMDCISKLCLQNGGSHHETLIDWPVETWQILVLSKNFASHEALS